MLTNTEIMQNHKASDGLAFFTNVVSGLKVSNIAKIIFVRLEN